MILNVNFYAFFYLLFFFLEIYKNLTEKIKQIFSLNGRKGEILLILLFVIFAEFIIVVYILKKFNKK